jgi:uncharacterized membrane protein YphA (DoxX/SURF4 family)
MNRIVLVARILLALAFAGFGLQYLRILPIVGPPWYPVGRVLPIAAGILLLAAAAGLLVRAGAHLVATLLGAGLLLRVLVFHLPQLLGHLYDPNIWTVFGEVLALAAGACILAASTLASALPEIFRGTALTRILAAGRYLFAVPLVISGILHFKYAFFISTLIPTWIPGRFFFANFVGLCFICAALAIATGIRARLAGYMLAAMFLLWVAILHAPRVAAASHNGNEWTSMFIALAMAGCSLAAAAIAPAKS